MDADLRGAYLGWSNLEGCNLDRAELHGAVFTHARLNNASLLAYSFSFGRTPVNLDVSCFVHPGKHRSHIDETETGPAEHTYRALKAYFTNEGNYDSASWAGFSERRMQRKSLWKGRRYSSWLFSLIFGVLTGYGEKPHRVVLGAVGTVLGYAVLYALFGLLSPPQTNWPFAFADALYFSSSTFCTFSAPLLTIQATLLAKTLVASEAFIGVFTMGLFVFTLTRRYVSRKQGSPNPSLQRTRCARR